MSTKGMFMKLKDKRFILYVTSKCAFCAKAKEQLKAKNISFDVISFDKRPKILKEVKEIYGWGTVPIVFERLENNAFKLVGGYTDLLNHLEII